MAASERGVCLIRFGERSADLLALLRAEFPSAATRRDRTGLQVWIDAIVDRIEGRVASPEVPLDVRGSRFQRRVWDALSRIPAGETRSYGELARAVGCPAGARAVGRACATNRLPVLIPCHRAIRGDGGLGGFLGGVTRKHFLLERERERSARPQAAVRSSGRPRVTTSVFS